jgi:hypothetical protein
MEVNQLTYLTDTSNNENKTWKKSLATLLLHLREANTECNQAK